MEPKRQLTKEVVAQEARFILDSLSTAGQFAKEVQFEELRHLCEQSVSLRLLDYVNFLERFGYLAYDRNTHHVSITTDGERVVGGEKVAELVIDVVHHFRPLLSRARVKEEPSVAPPARPRRSSGEQRDLVDNRYERLRTLGSGGIGTVYLARQILLDRQVALKEIRELFGFFSEPQRQEIVRRFDEEVRRVARLFHPNIATILDGNTTSDYPYVVSDYIAGGSLRRVIRAARTIPPELAVKIFLQLLHALRHAHSQGVVHRGLKPENVLFDAAGNVRVTDFGMSRVVERDQNVIQHVYVGMGSVAYLAPELFNDPTRVSPQSDLYALGIILYEMLARKLPGRRSPMPTKLHPQLPKVIDDLFDRLTQDDAAERYQSVEEAFEEFHKADAAKDFLEPRGAMLFLSNPIEKLEFEAETPEPADEPLATEGSGAYGPEDVGGSAAPSPQRIATSEEPAESQPLLEGPRRVPSSMVEVELEPTTADQVADLGGELLGEEGEVDGDGDSFRPRARRPYSFQQRIRERDK